MNLKTAFEPYFKIGAAISRKNLCTCSNTALLLEQFNSFTCENDMKPSFFLDEEANLAMPAKHDLIPALTFENARPYLDFAKANGIAMRGHTLIWHNQTPKWFFCKEYDENKGDSDCLVNQETDGTREEICLVFHDTLEILCDKYSVNLEKSVHINLPVPSDV